jgi:arabinogalactan endo-1,4-beta-galactosidase
MNRKKSSLVAWSIACSSLACGGLRGSSPAGGAPGTAGTIDDASGTTGAAGTPGTGGASGGGGGPVAGSYFLGADITFVQADEARGTTYSDGTTKDILQLLKDHGFNYIRLRAFVDPRATDGYDKQQGFGDLAHTIAFGQRIKAANMGFLLDLHYSDNWADPGKQCIPVAWQGMDVDQMVQAVHDYTKGAITELVAAGARPDMVQVGNEITPGMLIHICGTNGRPVSVNGINGSTSNWANLGKFLAAGSNGVKEVDPGIKVMLHIDRGGDRPADPPGAALQISIDWITNAINQGVSFDVVGESSYQLYQGDASSATNTASGWNHTYTELALRFPNLKLVAAEYGPLQREINDVVFNLPRQQGIGTFDWEPTRQGAWNTGHTLFSTTGNPRTAAPDLALFDEMKTVYGSRL